MIQIKILSILFTMLPLAACRDRPVPAESPGMPAVQTAGIPSASGCRVCHPVKPDLNHDLPCRDCHRGSSTSATREEAHRGMISKPADPDRMAQTCGKCHPETHRIGATLHFTNEKMINLVRRHFGATHDLATAADIPSRPSPKTPLELAEDLLGRSCLRCHISFGGDGYSETLRGTGCAACHLKFQNGRLLSHRFIKTPDDQQCRHCHYGNRVGSDYYGAFEHDFKHEYRTPYQPDGSYPERPRGVEEHRLRPDIHQQAGMICVDCHSGAELMAGQEGLGCESCHIRQPGRPLPADNLKIRAGQLLLTTRRGGKDLVVPLISSPVHQRYAKTTDCAVCHAQWSYTDQGHHLLRLDSDEPDEWEDLIVQGSFEAEVYLSNSLYGDRVIQPATTEKLSGRSRPGIWLQGYELRRWSRVLIGRNQAGRLQVMRPLLDLHLSFKDAEGRTVFDEIRGKGPGLIPYTPHTIGRAGTFYSRRLKTGNYHNLSSPLPAEVPAGGGRAEAGGSRIENQTK